MTTQNNTVAWPQRFGTIKSISVKNGRKGRYAVMTVDCKKFEQTAFAFTGKVIDQILAAGEGASVWFKGPMEPVQRQNANGGTYTEDQMKVVYFKNKSVATDETAGEPEAAEEETPAEPQDLTTIKGIGAAVAEQLTAAGITTYAELAVADAEALDAVKAGMGKRAVSGDWQAQAQVLVDAEKAAAEAEANAKVDDEIPF